MGHQEQQPAQDGIKLHMIRTIEVQNFRCYAALKIEKCAQLNVVVGDNGSGKTALFEGMFLALAASTEVAARLRQQRGIDGPLGGTARRIEEGLWGDFFHNYNWVQPIRIALSGEGPEISDPGNHSGWQRVNIAIGRDRPLSTDYNSTGDVHLDKFKKDRSHCNAKGVDNWRDHVARHGGRPTRFFLYTSQ